MGRPCQPVTYISLYSGGLGLDEGFKLAVPEARCVAYVEREASAVALILDHIEAGLVDATPIFTDTGTFDGRPFRGAVDAILAGFPCQPASVAGRRAGTSDERWLWPHVKQIAEEVMPSALFLENVRGLLSVGNGSAFEEVLTDLADMGFDARWCVVRASDVGAPHRRERLFILAVANGNRGNGNGSRSTRAGWWAEPANSGAELGHSRRQHVQLQQRVNGTEHPAAGGTVGDANGRGRWAQGDTGIAPEQPDKASRPMEWPPGPTDTDAWAAVLRERPDLAPAVADAKNGKSRQVGIAPRFSDAYSITAQPGVRNVADGLPGTLVGLPRVARLRILGNAVVAQQAAFAFRRLSDPLFSL